MGIDYAWFRAPDDSAAAVAEERPGGPLGWPVVVGRRKVGIFRHEDIVREAGPAYDAFARRGYDPMVTLGTLESILRGTPYDDLEADARWGGSVAADANRPDEGDPRNEFVVTITDSLCDALCEADDTRLADVVAEWARTEELNPPYSDLVPLEEHRAFVVALRGLACRARQEGEHLYCYVSV